MGLTERMLLDPEAADSRGYLIRSEGGGALVTFVTGGVNGKTADQTAAGNMADLSERMEGELTLYAGGALPVWSNGSEKIATAIHGVLTSMRDLDAEIQAAGGAVQETNPGTLEWARAHAELERLVYEKAGLPWSREGHFVTRMEREES